MVNAEILAVPLVERDERSLIARAAAGDRGATRALYEAHVSRVYRLAFRMSGDADLARDLTQDVFVRVFRRLDRFRGESAFTTWLHRVAVTTCLNGLRKVRRLREREVPLLEHHHDTAARSVDLAMRQALATAIEALPDELRVVLVMHAIEGYTHAEVAEALGIAEGTSKSREFEARKRLRRALGGDNGGNRRSREQDGTIDG
jgi:RNA polymerase sigma-70 factor, ECF subfamily